MYFSHLFTTEIVFSFFQSRGEDCHPLYPLNITTMQELSIEDSSFPYVESNSFTISESCDNFENRYRQGKGTVL